MDEDRLIVAGTVVVVLVALAVVAGLLGLVGNPLEGPPDSVDDLDEEDLPDGVTKAGVTDPRAVADDHDASLSGRSYRTRLVVDRTTTDGDRTRERTETRVVAVDGDQFSVRVDREDGLQREFWGNDSAVFARVSRGDRTSHDRVGDAGEVRRNLSGRQVVGQLLAAGDYELAAIERRDGESLLRLTADRSTGDAGVPFARSIGNFSGTALTTRSGRVRNLTAQMDYVSDEGRSVSASFAFELRRVGGVSVDRPDWVARAT
jgi:hypothetical protein